MAIQASFTPEEQHTIDKLREKYSGLRVADNATELEDPTSCLRCEATPPSAPCTAAPKPQAASTQAASSVEASICPHCNGTGTLVEIYNHRRLENFCQPCDGRGVRVFKHGVEVVPGAGRGAADSGSGSTKPLTSGSVAGPAGVMSLHNRPSNVVSKEGGEGEALEGVRERVEALQRDLTHIAEKTALYTKERSDALTLLKPPQLQSQPTEPADSSLTDSTDSIPASSGAQAAARELIAQLDLQLKRLEEVRQRKAAALKRLTGGPVTAAGTGVRAGVGLDDIITNEGGAGV